MGAVYYRHSMVRHHTKDKGDLGVAKAHADLAAKGFTVLFPATEHAPFDLVAYAEGLFHRLQVKYWPAPSPPCSRRATSSGPPTTTTRPLCGSRPAETGKPPGC